MVPQASEAFGERNTEQRAARTRQTQGTAAGEKHRRLRVRAAEHHLGSRSPRDSSVPRQDAPHGPRRSPACRRGRAERGGGARRGAGLRSAERRERHRRPRQSPLPARAARLRSGPSRGPGGVARQRGVHTAVRPPAMAAGLGLPRRRRRLAREWSLAGAGRRGPRARAAPRDPGGVPPSLPSGSAARSRLLSDPRPRAVPDCQVPRVKPARTGTAVGRVSGAAA